MLSTVKTDIQISKLYNFKTSTFSTIYLIQSSGDVLWCGVDVEVTWGHTIIAENHNENKNICIAGLRYTYGYLGENFKDPSQAQRKAFLLIRLKLIIIVCLVWIILMTIYMVIHNYMYTFGRFSNSSRQNCFVHSNCSINSTKRKKWLPLYAKISAHRLFRNIVIIKFMACISLLMSNCIIYHRRY